MSTLAQRLKAMRLQEELTQLQLCEATGISLSSYKKYELSLRREVGAVALLQITQHERFKKYALWLMTGDADLSTPQISAG